MERRLPISIVVSLNLVQEQPAKGTELTYTENVSAHGARVISKRHWQSGEVAVVTSLKDEVAIRGKVVYCQKLPDNRYCLGLNFNGGGVTWSTYRAYSDASS
jgi:PilZ domain-containing protein